MALEQPDEAPPGSLDILTSAIPLFQYALLRAFEIAGIQFIPQNGGGLGVRLRDPVLVSPSS